MAKRKVGFFAKRSFSSGRGDFYDDLALAIVEGESELGFVRERELSARKQKQSVAEIYRAIYDELFRGATIVKAAGPFLPLSDVAVLTAYLNKGDLPAGLRKQAGIARKIAEAQSIINGVLMSPAVVIVVVIGILVIIQLLVSPVVIQLQPDPSKIVLPGRIVMAIASAVYNYWWVIFPAIGGLLYWLIGRVPRWSGRTRAKFDGWPVLSLYRDFSSAQSLGAMAALMEAGKPIPQAADELARISSPWARWHLMRISAHLRRTPTDISGAFSSGFVSRKVAARLDDLLRRSSPDKALSKLGESAVDGLLPRVKTMSKVTEFLLAAVIGLVMNAIIGSMGYTMFSAGEDLKASIYMMGK